MKKILIFFVGLMVVSCLSEKSADPGKGATFIRYYNGGNNDQAQSLEQTPDGGWIIMANTKIQKAEADVPRYKIKLIRTDAQGNPMWTKLFPPTDDTTGKDFSGSQLQLIPTGGYVISGDDIKNGGNKSLLLTVDDSGNLIKPASSYGLNISGKGVAVSSAGNYFVLTVAGSKQMGLLEYDKNTLIPRNLADTSIFFAAGDTELAKKVFIDPDGWAVWSGKVTKSDLTGIRVTKGYPGDRNPRFDYQFCLPGFDEVGADICKFGDLYAVIGSTNQKAGQAVAGTDTDILFMMVETTGRILSSQTFPIGDPSVPDNQNDVGNSISATQDGGLILLSSVNSVALKEKGKGDTDYYLIKINAFGDKDWVSPFGSRFKDDGAAVRQATDGGYVVLGTTTQGGLKLVTLIKTDKTGKVE